jgi:hypothetical protein
VIPVPNKVTTVSRSKAVIGLSTKGTIREIKKKVVFPRIKKILLSYRSASVPQRGERKDEASYLIEVMNP